MKKALIFTLIGVAAIGLAASMLTNQPKPATTDTSKAIPAQPKAVDNNVVIQNYAFSPSVLTVKKDTTVTWTNTDVAKHSVVAEEGQPAGGPSSPLFGKDGTYQFTFTTAGTYKYICGPHPYMHGTVVVTE
jgi:plastocyanin